MNLTDMKRTAAERAVEFVESGMVVGLGHGSTAAFAVQKLAHLIRTGALRDIVGVPCSKQMEAAARELGIPLTTLDERPAIDITIDGADEVDLKLNLIKGGGGALLREKIVAQASRREVIVVDTTKLVSVLGERFPLPVEVVPFGWRTQVAFLESLRAKVSVRMDPEGREFRSDQGNLILDCDFGRIDDPSWLARRLEARAGIVGHGLFIGLATDLIAATNEGCRHVRRD